MPAGSVHQSPSDPQTSCRSRRGDFGDKSYPTDLIIAVKRNRTEKRLAPIASKGDRETRKFRNKRFNITNCLLKRRGKRRRQLEPNVPHLFLIVNDYDFGT